MSQILEQAISRIIQEVYTGAACFPWGIQDYSPGAIAVLFLNIGKNIKK
jgi:hypothetical protein